jgi:predicted DNA-binding transcriptional regulator YafY
MSLNKGQKLVMMVEMMHRRGGITASELADRFELEPRSLRRYLSDLRGLGIPVEDLGRGADRVIALEARWRRTGVQLTLAEILSLHFGRTLFNFLEGSSFACDLDGAIERLEPAISRAHQDLARQLDTKFLAVPEHAKDYRGEAGELVDEVVTALVYGNPLVARYRKAVGEVKPYQLHPYTLATYRQGLYLFALDVEAGQVKTFAVERFIDLERVRGQKIEVPAGWRPQAYLAHAFGIISGPAEEVAIAFDRDEATYVRERTWHPTQSFRSRQDGRLELRMRVALGLELEDWIRSFGDRAQVLSPPQLVARVAESLRKASAQYGDRR